MAAFLFGGKMENNLKVVETRLVLNELKSTESIVNPEVLIRFVDRHISERDTELMSVIYLNSKCKVIDFDLCKTNTFEKNYKYILSQAIVKNSTSMCLVSNMDHEKAFDQTMMFSDACKLMGLKLFDHVCRHSSFLKIYGFGEDIAYHDKISVESGTVVAEEPLSYLKTTSAIDMEFDAVQSVCNELMDSDRENLYIVNYDKNNVPINCSVASIGTYTMSPAEPSLLFKPALLCGASSFAVIHNHPSGDPAPSSDDLSLFKRLYDAGHLLGLEMEDAVIIGSITGDKFSYRDSGEMDRMIKESQHLVNYKKAGGR